MWKYKINVDLMMNVSPFFLFFSTVVKILRHKTGGVYIPNTSHNFRGHNANRIFFSVITDFFLNKNNHFYWKPKAQPRNFQ
jgi:hypothetical protein